MSAIDDAIAVVSQGERHLGFHKAMPLRQYMNFGHDACDQMVKNLAANTFARLIVPQIDSFFIQLQNDERYQEDVVNNRAEMYIFTPGEMQTINKALLEAKRLKERYS